MISSNTVVGCTTVRLALLLLLSSLTGSACLSIASLVLIQRGGSEVLYSRESYTSCIAKNYRRSTPISPYTTTTSSASFIAFSDRRSDLTSKIGLQHYAKSTDDSEEDVRSISAEEVESSSEDDNSTNPLARINSFLDTPNSPRSERGARRSTSHIRTIA